MMRKTTKKAPAKKASFKTCAKCPAPAKCRRAGKCLLKGK